MDASAGNTAATEKDFGERLVTCLPKLRRFAFGLARNAAQADDLVQAACEKALAARSSFEPGTNFNAWVFRILRNTWIDVVRRKRTAGPQEDIDSAYDLAGHDGARETEARLVLSDVQRAILRLPSELREVLMLVCVEELSYRDAAETLGIPIGTVMSRLARARLKLAKETGYGTQDES